MSTADSSTTPTTTTTATTTGPSPATAIPVLTATAAPELPAFTQALLTSPTKPHWLVSLLKVLAGLAALCTLLTGYLAYLDNLPPKYAGFLGALAIGLVALQHIVIGLGDLLDDGVINGSFPDKTTSSLWLIPAMLAGCLLLLAGCKNFSFGDGTFSAGIAGEKDGQTYHAEFTVPLPRNLSTTAPAADSAKDVNPVTPN